MNWDRFFQPQILVFLIPIFAILVGGAVKITKLIISHKERLAMIEQGMDPDAHAAPQASLKADQASPR